MKKQYIIGLSLILLVIIAGASYLTLKNKKNKYNAYIPSSDSSIDQDTSTQSTQNQETDAQPQTQNGGPFVFSQNLDKLSFTPNYQESDVTLEIAQNWAAMEKKYDIHLTSAQQAYLNKNKFILVPLKNTTLDPKGSMNFDEMLTSFDAIKGDAAASMRQPENAKLVTPDVVLHAYHKFFELTLEELETNELSTALETFLVGLANNIQSAAKNDTPELKTHYQDLFTQVTVARVLLENKNTAQPSYFENSNQEQNYKEADKTIDNLANAKKILVKYSGGWTSDSAQKAERELALIYDPKSLGLSPLFGVYAPGVKTDYTQYTPRSHYAKNSALRAYFRSMMYLGRNSYFINSDNGIKDTMLLTQLYNVKNKNGSSPLVAWQKIMNITSFYAGQSDDLTYTEWQKFLNDAGINPAAAPGDLISQTTIQKIKDNANKLRRPRIISDIIVDENIERKTKDDLLLKSLSFRIFGQRFTFDAWVLNDLTKGDEASESALVSMPTAAYIPAALGDARAKQVSEEYLQKNYKFTPAQVQSFDTVLLKKQNQLKDVNLGDWFSSMGNAWIYVLSAETGKFNQGYPRYMQSTPFVDKQLQTFLGSYTELKHDTVLYAKQSYAEKGGGPGSDAIAPVVKGFVEPNVILWQKLLTLVDYTRYIFDSHGLFQNHAAASRLHEFRKIVSFYQTLAEKELQNITISDNEYEQLRTTDLAFMGDPFEVGDPTEDSKHVALVADVHTDGVSGNILYEATGEPYVIVALVGDALAPRTVIGVAYNHYEFTNPLGKRVTDEEWKQKVYQAPGTLPAKNFWYTSLITK